MRGSRENLGDPFDFARLTKGPAERRVAPRYPAKLKRGWIGWHSGREFRLLPCWFRDVSANGMRVGLHELPALGGPVLVRLDGEGLPVWFEASILEVLPEEVAGFHTARLRFAGTCPYGLFMAIAYGRLAREPVAWTPGGPRIGDPRSTRDVPADHDEWRRWTGFD